MIKKLYFLFLLIAVCVNSQTVINPYAYSGGADPILALSPDVYFTPDSMTASVWSDTSGNGLDGTVVGTASVETGSGVNVLTVNGSSYVDLPVDPSLVKVVSTDNFSVVWREGPTLWTTGYAISKADANGANREFGVFFSGTAVSTYIGGVTTALATPPQVGNKLWIMNFNAGNWEVFCDGVSLGTGTTGSLTTTAQSVNFFGRSDGSYLANNAAGLSVVAIIPNTLSAGDRTDIANFYQIN